jgi:hypothetical protein
MLSNHTLDNTGAKSVVVKTSGNEKIRVPIMLEILAQRRKCSNSILKHKIMPRGINVTSMFMGGWPIHL